MSSTPILSSDDFHFAIELVRADLHHLRKVIDLASREGSSTESISAYEALYERAASRLRRFELTWRHAVTREHAAGHAAVGSAA